MFLTRMERWFASLQRSRSRVGAGRGHAVRLFGPIGFWQVFQALFGAIAMPICLTELRNGNEGDFMRNFVKFVNMYSSHFQQSSGKR